MRRAKGRRSGRAFDEVADAQAAIDEQLAAWLRGENNHNRRTGACVPDFACCWPENAMTQELRERFVSLFKTSRH